MTEFWNATELSLITKQSLFGNFLNNIVYSINGNATYVRFHFLHSWMLWIIFVHQFVLRCLLPSKGLFQFFSDLLENVRHRCTMHCLHDTGVCCYGFMFILYVYLVLKTVGNTIWTDIIEDSAAPENFTRYGRLEIRSIILSKNTDALRPKLVHLIGGMRREFML